MGRVTARLKNLKWAHGEEGLPRSQKTQAVLPAVVFITWVSPWVETFCVTL